MLKKQNRLGRSEALKQVIRRGRITRVQGFLIRTLKTRLPVSRFAVSISHKTEKSAVRRNAVRRQLYSILRQHINHIVPGLDCSITVQRDAITESREHRKEIFICLLSRSRILKQQ